MNDLAADLKTDLCPICSRFKKDHAELMTDVLVFPSIYPGRHRGPLEKFTRWYVSRCCEHANDLRGPWNTEEIANQLWSDRVTKLRAEKEQRRIELEQSLARINESKTGQLLNLDASAAPAMVQGRSKQARDELQQLDEPATEPRASDGEHGATSQAGDAGCSVGDQDAMKVWNDSVENTVSAACEVGSNIWLSHSMNWVTKKCDRCGFEYPA